MARKRRYRGGGQVSNKIRKLRGEGYPQKQAVAIALDMKRRGKLADGGYMRKKMKYPYGGLTEHEGADTLGIAPIQTDANSLTGGDLLSTITKKYQDGGRLKPHEWMKTPLNYVEERFFKKWLEEHGLTDRDDYDMRGAFKAGLTPITPDGNALLPVRDRKTGLSFLKPGGVGYGTYVEEFDEEEFVPKFDLLSGRHRTFRRPHTHARETWSLRKGGIAPIQPDTNKYSQYPLGGILPAISLGLDAAKFVSGLFKEDPANPYMKNIQPFAHGGAIGRETNRSKQYNAPSHAQGGQMIDARGMPTSSDANSVGEVQNKENMYRFNDDTSYVFSDELLNPYSGKSFSDSFKGILKKYTAPDAYQDEKNAVEVEAKELANLNDIVRESDTQTTYQDGGELDPLPTLMGPVIPGMIRETPMLPTLNISPTPQAGARPLDVNVPGTTTMTADDTLGPTTSNDTSGGLSGLDKGSVALKSLGLVKSFADMITPYKRETPILPDYTAADRQFSRATADYSQAKQDALAQSNVASQLNRGASGSYSQYRARELANQANLQDVMGRIQQRETDRLSDISLRRGAYEADKARDIANRQYQSRVDTAQNQANKQFAAQKFFTELTQVGTTLNNYQYALDEIKNNKELAEMTINEGMSILRAKYPNFRISDNLIEKLQDTSLTMGDLIEFVQ